MNDDVTNNPHIGDNVSPVSPVTPETTFSDQPITVTHSDLESVTDSAAVTPLASPTLVSAQHNTAPQAWVYQEPESASGNGRNGVRAGVIAGVIAGLISGILGYGIGAQFGDGGLSSTTLTAVEGDTSPRAEGSIAAIAKAVLPVVVSIDVTSTSGGGGTGSGFIVRSSATSSYILTNNHVVVDAANGGDILVAFQDQSETPATIVGRDPSYDLAVIKVQRGNLPVATLGDSSSVVVGDSAIAVGSPLGLSGTVTSGIVSALNRPVTAGGASESSFINAIQTDAAINPGNSGGPLVNGKGQVIGINSAIATLGNNSLGSTETGSIGLGFAIPINEARRVANQLISTGKSSHPIIGVSLDLNYTGKGARISAITSGGPASETDLAIGDIITKIDGMRVSDATELIVRIRAKNPGDTVVLTLDDGSKVEVVLGSRTSS